MTERERIADQIRRAYEGEAWHGPSLRELLSGLSAEKAAAHPVSGAHAIWELVLHVTTWERYVMKRLQAGPGEKHEPSDEENFPRVADTSGAAWKKTLDELKLTNERLCAMIRDLGSDARLDDSVPGKNYNVYIMLHGVLQHNLYHAGQIALLKK